MQLRKEGLIWSTPSTKGTAEIRLGPRKTTLGNQVGGYELRD